MLILKSYLFIIL